jgi:hypothetical protein
MSLGSIAAGAEGVELNRVQYAIPAARRGASGRISGVEAEVPAKKPALAKSLQTRYDLNSA